jgi:hypothetical protein
MWLKNPYLPKYYMYSNITSYNSCPYHKIEADQNMSGMCACICKAGTSRLPIPEAVRTNTYTNQTQHQHSVGRFIKTEKYLLCMLHTCKLWILAKVLWLNQYFIQGPCKQIITFRAHTLTCDTVYTVSWVGWGTQRTHFESWFNQLSLKGACVMLDCGPWTLAPAPLQIGIACKLYSICGQADPPQTD